MNPRACVWIAGWGKMLFLKAYLSDNYANLQFSYQHIAKFVVTSFKRWIHKP
jgi:hypothetical protein